MSFKQWPRNDSRCISFCRLSNGQEMIAHIQLQNCLCFPMSPVKIISVIMLARQFNDQDGTWIKTFWYYVTFSWYNEKYTIDFSHPYSKLPMLQVNPGYSKLVSFCSLFEVENDRHHPIPSHDISNIIAYWQADRYIFCNWWHPPWNTCNFYCYLKRKETARILPG